MKPYSASVRVNYDGRAVETGSRRTAQAMGRVRAEQSRGNAASVTAIRQNSALATSYSRVAASVSAALVSYAGFTLPARWPMLSSSIFA